ncbi:MAG TPA: hydantoinase B/oxoprolinase family protein [Anaerolineales bacterium]|nr:hydantoinase B/oxoprolinase family protein [Anaerolineales bacterium]
MNPIRLEIFKHLFSAIPEEMGALLRRAAYSPNIKERLDFSCAIFDAAGDMIAQAAHIPVHLGAMPLSVAAAVRRFGDPGIEPFRPGDVVILNDPYHGGSHLPDITLVSPVFLPEGDLFGFAASRAHHADVGGMAPGSMPIARHIVQEGLILPPVRLVHEGAIDRDIWDLILANVRTPAERAGDLRAQLAANARGVERLGALVEKYGRVAVSGYIEALYDYTERLTRALIREIGQGEFEFEDRLDDDGVDEQPVRIRVRVRLEGDAAEVDFTGTAGQRRGSVNAVRAITLSAVAYVFRCLLSEGVPNNAGALRPIRVITPERSVVDAAWPAPVAGGNVETSQRIVDALLGAFAQALPDRIPAAGQGTMNNTLIGGTDLSGRPFTYYETIAGGMGGGPDGPGVSGRHVHMTNTLNTPVEALEFAYPMRVERYEIRRGTGGGGRHPGGDGVRRDLRMLVEAEASLIADRRKRGPYGLQGGASGACGVNILIRGGREIGLPAKGSVDLQPGDVLSIRTPGGGGWGYNF